MRRGKSLGGWILALTALLISSSFGLGAESGKQTSSERRAATRQVTTSKHRAARTSSRKKVKATRRSGRGSSRRRLAKLHLDPQRVEEIQRALVQGGYLNQEPTGKWDVATRAAMRRFQTDNGFPATGMPEAKSLMKLGLGPHELPEDVDANAAARARLESSPNASPPADQPPSRDPAKKDPPRNH